MKMPKGTGRPKTSTEKSAAHRAELLEADTYLEKHRIKDSVKEQSKEKTRDGRRKVELKNAKENTRRKDNIEWGVARKAMYKKHKELDAAGKKDRLWQGSGDNAPIDEIFSPTQRAGRAAVKEYRAQRKAKVNADKPKIKKEKANPRGIVSSGKKPKVPAGRSMYDERAKMMKSYNKKR
jgi:hypothetical protein